MHTHEWPQKDIGHVFFDLFLVPQTRDWILASPFSDSIRRFDDVIAYLCTESSWALLEAMRFAQSVFLPPELYRCFDQSFQVYAITAADALTAVELLSHCTEIPYSLDPRAYHDVKREMLYSPFLIRGFPPSGSGVAPWDSRVIFAGVAAAPPPANAEFERLYRLIDQRRTTRSVFGALADSRFRRAREIDGFPEFALAQSIADLAAKAARFEAYLCLMARVRALRSWRELSDRHATVALAAVPSEAIARSLPVPLQRMRVIATRGARFALLRAAFEGALSRLQFFLSGELAKRELAAQRRMESPAAAARVFRQIVQVLACLGKAELHRRFEIVATALRKADALGGANAMLDALAVAQGIPFMESFLVLTACVVKHPDFCEMLSDVDLHNWTKFENALVHLVSESESKELTRTFLQTQAQIEEFLTAAADRGRR
jgi:hypothetical protein